MIQLSAAQVFEYDQALAASVDMFTELLASYIACRNEDIVNGYPEQYTVVSLACSLGQWDIDQLASALAVSVLLVAEHMEAKHVE